MKRLLTETEVWQEFGLSVPWLQRDRLTGPTLQFCKIGRAVRYRRQDIEAFLAACVVGQVDVTKRRAA
ncbi:MAG: helix-turn-helix transcriptional regulator [Bryobacteraceae bacterium]